MGAQLIVSRDLKRDIKIRGLFISLDGREVKDLYFGNTLDMPVEPGKHLLKVSNRLYNKEAEFEVANGETARFQAGNFISGFWAVILGWSGFLPYKVFLERVAD